MSRRLTLSIEEAAELLGVGRSLAYQQARQGSLAGIKVLKVGKRLLVPVRALEDLLGVILNGMNGHMNEP